MDFGEFKLRILKPIFFVCCVFIIAMGLFRIQSFLDEESYSGVSSEGIESSFQRNIKRAIKQELGSPSAQEWSNGDESTQNTFFEERHGEEARFDIEGTAPIRTVEPPKDIQAIYLTAHTALSWRQDYFLSFVDRTDLNAIVVNVKDGEGIFQGPSMKYFVEKAKEKGIWTIGRIVVMQDNSFVAQKPNVALRDAKGAIWKDSLGLNWVDPASQEVWDYNVQIAKEIVDLGFDELNFDYVRFPSDGTLQEIWYPFWSGVTPKHEIMKQFFAYLTSKLKEYNPQVVLSADLFAYNLLKGMVYDVVIGQHVEDAALYFDVIAPMIYPSHYLPLNFGFENPAEHPYEVVRGTLEQGRDKILKVRANAVIRPWLQAFDMGAVYGKNMIDSQKKAVQDAGFNYGWMLWNPNNIYQEEWFILSE
jgi:hypothetical protein